MICEKISSVFLNKSTGLWGLGLTLSPKTLNPKPVQGLGPGVHEYWVSGFGGTRCAQAGFRVQGLGVRASGVKWV